MSKDNPTWQMMSELVEAIKKDNQSGNFSINAKAEDIGKCISDLCDEIHRLRQEIKRLEGNKKVTPTNIKPPLLTRDQ